MIILNFLKSKKGLISVFEIAFIFVLFSGILVYVNNVSEPNKNDYKFTIESALNSIYYDENNRVIFMDEDLSSSTITSNWTNISNYLDSIFLNYDLIISNNSISKNIYSCNSTYEKYYSEKIISIKNNTVYEFRKIKLGVCY